MLTSILWLKKKIEFLKIYIHKLLQFLLFVSLAPAISWQLRISVSITFVCQDRESCITKGCIYCTCIYNISIYLVCDFCYFLYACKTLYLSYIILWFYHVMQVYWYLFNVIQDLIMSGQVYQMSCIITLYHEGASVPNVHHHLVMQVSCDQDFSA